MKIYLKFLKLSTSTLDLFLDTVCVYVYVYVCAYYIWLASFSLHAIRLNAVCKSLAYS